MTANSFFFFFFPFRSVVRQSRSPRCNLGQDRQFVGPFLVIKVQIMAEELTNYSS